MDGVRSGSDGVGIWVDAAGSQFASQGVRARIRFLLFMPAGRPISDPSEPMNFLVIYLNAAREKLQILTPPCP